MLFIIRTSLSVEDPTLRREVYLDSLCTILSDVRRFLGPVALRESQNINPYLDEVRSWVRSLRAADAGRPSSRSGLLSD